MSGLVHISKYLDEFKLEIEKYENELTKCAEDVSTEVKRIQEVLGLLKVEPFYHWWSVLDDDDSCSLSVGLGWNGSKVEYLFEHHDAEVLLGLNRETRVAVAKYLVPFLEKGLKNIKEKTEKIGSID